jgi:hypothetical protein
VRFVGFEGSGLGDPTWDLASALGTVRELSARWGVDCLAAGEWLLEGYAAGGGRHEVTDAMECARSLTAAWLAAVTAPTGGVGLAAEAVDLHLRDARFYAACAARSRAA